MRTFILLSCFVVIVALSVQGCANTVRGMGKDLDKAGDSMQKI